MGLTGWSRGGLLGAQQGRGRVGSLKIELYILKFPAATYIVNNLYIIVNKYIINQSVVQLIN